MKTPLTALCALAIGAALSAQTSTNSLEFRHGGAVTVSHAHLDLARGETLGRLMADGEEATRFRQFFNENGFTSRIRGTLELSHTTELAGTELDAGNYKLSFHIDEDRMWYLVVLSDGGDEIFRQILDVKEDDSDQLKRLVIRPVATDNAKGKGQMNIGFGSLHAMVPMAVLDADKGTPGQNTNQDAPMAGHKLEMGNGTVFETSYRQLTLAGGQSLKTLLSEGERGDGMRTFYNDQYLPSMLNGKLSFTTPLNIGGHPFPPGEHEFTFRIDNDLSWHVVVNKASMTLETESQAEVSDRLQVLPVASSEDEGAGYLSIRYGPLCAKLPFGRGLAGTDSRPSDGDN